MNTEFKNIHFDDLDLKTDGEDKGVFTGYGSTFGGKPDSYGDIVDNGAFTNTLRKNGGQGLGVAMLWSHDTDRPVGTWEELVEDSKGLKVRGRLAIESTDGGDMYQLMKIKAVKGLSIGYGVVEYEMNRDIRHLKELSLWEISPTVFPANNRAKIGSVKSKLFDVSTKRDLEGSLRELGLSTKEAVYVASLIDESKIKKEENEAESKELKEILGHLGSLKDAFN